VERKIQSGIRYSIANSYIQLKVLWNFIKDNFKLVLYKQFKNTHVLFKLTIIECHSGKILIKTRY